ncbi:division septum protein Blr [Salmonella enterica]|nr:division septum protein Blr [Salmonella enterica]EJA7738851.1 division septum protein Blr [Salmonella enterica]
MNRLIELTGWIVLVISVILLGIANHIDNYQPPEPTASVQKNVGQVPQSVWRYVQ